MNGDEGQEDIRLIPDSDHISALVNGCTTGTHAERPHLNAAPYFLLFSKEREMSLF